MMRYAVKGKKGLQEERIRQEVACFKHRRQLSSVHSGWRLKAEEEAVYILPGRGTDLEIDRTRI